MTPPSKLAQCSGVLFDLDGTLIDSAPDLGQALNRLLDSQKKPSLPLNIVRQWVSDGASALVQVGTSLDQQDPNFSSYVEKMLQFYDQATCVNTQPYKGIEAMLRGLAAKQLPWGIVTNKPSRFTLKIMTALQLQPPPAVVICGDQLQQTKPHPEGLLKAATELNLSPQYLCYVGDHKRDIIAGKKAGMITVAVSWGYHKPQEHPQDWGAHYCIDHVEELNELLDSAQATNL